MKNRILFLLLATMIFACNEPVKKEDKMVMSHQEKPMKNAMMDAMDETMMGMHHAKQTGNADYDFAAMMVPHHKGAVKMAEELLKTTRSVALKDFANQVINAQHKEIDTFEDFLKTASQKPSPKAAQFKEALNRSMEPMMQDMEMKKYANNDSAFVELMIPHHESAVAMAKAYLPYSNNLMLKKIAKQIIESQTAEIGFLKKQ